MGYTKTGPFVSGGAPGIDSPFLDNVETALVAVMNGKGVIADRPAAGNSGARYFATDEGVEYRDNGTTWDRVVPEPTPGVSEHDAILYALIFGGG